MKELTREVTYHVIAKYLCLQCDGNFAVDKNLVKGKHLDQELSCPYCRSQAVEVMAWINDQEQLDDMGCGVLGMDITTTYQCPDCNRYKRIAEGKVPNIKCATCQGTGEITIVKESKDEIVKALMINSRLEKGLPVPSDSETPSV